MSAAEVGPITWSEGVRLAAALHAAIGRRVRLDVPSTDDLAAAVARVGEPVLLVLDDLHELADTKAMVELEQLLLAAPQNLTVLIGSRVMPPINLAWAKRQS